jgi:YesN/AraC family two-component response regulator
LIHEDRRDKHARLFATMREHVETHYADQLTLNHLAMLAGLSPGYFSRLFKEYNGVSFVEHLNNVRIRNARQLISSGMKIQETAAAVGFTDYSYFSKVFRQIEGVSPREFQQNQI